MRIGGSQRRVYGNIIMLYERIRAAAEKRYQRIGENSGKQKMVIKMLNRCSTGIVKRIAVKAFSKSPFIEIRMARYHRSCKFYLVIIVAYMPWGCRKNSMRWCA